MIASVNCPENTEELPALPMQISMDNLMDILAELDDGVIITDDQGTVVFYNEAISRIDNMERSLVIGKKVTDIYSVTRETSPTMQALMTRRPVLRFTQFYLTHHGRAVFALQNVFPLFEKERFKGVVNFIREYSSIEREMDVTSRFHIQKRKKSTDKNTFDNLIGSDPEFLQNIRTGKKAAPSPSPVMIYGESGTGKELFAQAIHNYSPRSDKPFVAINCSAIPETLLEGILFGTAKGAFTDARDKPGLFEDADGGTLFLDEINSMPIGLQAKLLRAIQENKIRRVGSSREIDIQLKLISSVNMEPEQAMQADTLRRDLYYRLAVVYLSIPPLRLRLTDIPALVDHFIQRCNKRLSRQVHTVSKDVLHLFFGYHWPGNVRELAHVIEGAMNLVENRERIEYQDLPRNFVNAIDHKEKKPGSSLRLSTPEKHFYSDIPVPEPDDGGMTLFDLQRRYEKKIICRLLEKYKGNANQAARQLGISRQLIYHKIKKHQIQRDAFKS
jgi:arginine utilization regulatory protein